ncbi:MAG TPA: hypothetical protein EYP08_03250 [Pyrodictiaceae archaeon]|nr:hypothetical protein [Pyrodictiaceae archaeon]
MPDAGVQLLLDGVAESTGYTGTLFILFYSKRCPMCRDVISWWHKLVRNYKGYAVFLALPYNKDTRRLFDGFAVSYVPALIVVKDGIVIKRIEPIRSRKDLETAIIENLILVP